MKSIGKNTLDPVIDRIIAIRRDIHAHPEIGFEEVRTARIAADFFREIGCDEVCEGIGKTGVVAVINGSMPGASIGLRADMDALNLVEKTGVEWSSQTEGCMHGCGHDGHVAWALAVAWILCNNRDFAGRAVIVIQPGEEGYAGGRAMIEDGLFERFDVDEIYAGHGGTDVKLGVFGITSGPVMAAADKFFIDVCGRGGHGGRPQKCIDPIVAACELVGSMQQVVSRNADPMHPAVITFGSIVGGDEQAMSVVPDSVRLSGTTRCMHPEDRDMIERRMNEICQGIALQTECEVKLDYIRMYPPLINHEEQLQAVAQGIREHFGEESLDFSYPASMGAEDFSFMLEKRPGAYVKVGMRDESHTCFAHNPGFDFNDKCIAPTAVMFADFIRKRLEVLNKRA